MTASHDFDQSIAFAGRTLTYLKKNRTPATPPNYELWYTYASGENPQLVAAINEVMAERAGVSPQDAKRLYDTYLSPNRVCDKVEEVGGLLTLELREVIAHVQEAARRSGKFGDSLDILSNQLTDARDPAQLKNIVLTLASVTRDMAKQSHELEARLEDSTRQIQELHDSLEAVRRETFTDQLTGIANRRKFDQVLEEQIAHAKETGEPLCLLMIDIDHFKAFNDNWGHQTGDQVLRLVAHTLKTNVKGRDLAARYGGEEFALILPKTSLNDGYTVGEHIRKAVRFKELIKKSTGENLGRITVSIGAAVYHPDDTPESLIQRADMCLYAAKRAGRDRVVCEGDPETFTDTNAA